MNISTKGLLLPWPKSGNTHNVLSSSNECDYAPKFPTGVCPACRAHQAFIRLHGAVALWLVPGTEGPAHLSCFGEKQEG